MYLRQRLCGYGLIVADNQFVAILSVSWLRILLNKLIVYVDKPGFSNTCFSVSWKFLIAIILDGCIRNLDNEKDIIWSWMGIGVKIFSWLEERQIRLWFRIIVQLNRVLNTQNSSISNLTADKRSEPINEGGMDWTNWAHKTYLSVDQFDAIIFG